jgi:hypothetical protein
MLTATGGNKKVGLRPLHGATRFRAKTEYIPGVRQLQGTRVGTARNSVVQQFCYRLSGFHPSSNLLELQ